MTSQCVHVRQDPETLEDAIQKAKEVPFSIPKKRQETQTLIFFGKFDKLWLKIATLFWSITLFEFEVQMFQDVSRNLWGRRAAERRGQSRILGEKLDTITYTIFSSGWVADSGGWCIDSVILSRSSMILWDVHGFGKFLQSTRVYEGSTSSLYSWRRRCNSHTMFGTQ